MYRPIVVRFTEEEILGVDEKIQRIRDNDPNYTQTNLSSSSVFTQLVELGNDQVQQLADALRGNTTLTSINLRGNELGAGEAQGLQYLADALRVNTNLTEINLQENRMGSGEAQGLQYLTDALRVNTTLTKVSLAGNGIDAQGARYLAEALRVNTSLTRIDLGWNKLGADYAKGVQYLADALGVNTSLKRVALQYNKIDPRGARYLADGLRVNTCLTLLDLEDNRIGAEGANYLADALRVQVPGNTKAFGKFKDEQAKDPIIEFCGRAPKEYSYQTASQENTLKGKGVPGHVLKGQCSHADAVQMILSSHDPSNHSKDNFERKVNFKGFQTTIIPSTPSNR